MRLMTIAAALSLAGVSSAATAATPRYQPANLLGTGYSDHQIAPDLWDVSGASAQPDGGHAIAIYRAAELAAASHATQIRVVDQHILVTMQRTGGFVREVAHLTVRAVHSDADLTACRTRHAERCVTLSVARMAARFGPMLDQPATLPGVPVEWAALPRPGSAATSIAVEPLSPREQGRRAALAALGASGASAD